MKVIIAGSRTFNNFDLLLEKCDHYLQAQAPNVEIVSGQATGADKLGETYAQLKGYPIAKFPADWDTHGKSAGYKRNVRMAEYADALIAFWDGKSKGTKHMINIAREKGLMVRIVRY